MRSAGVACSFADTAHLYRRALEWNAANVTDRALAEERVALKEIADAIGMGLDVPVVSLAPGEQ